MANIINNPDMCRTKKKKVKIIINDFANNNSVRSKFF